MGRRPLLWGACGGGLAGFLLLVVLVWLRTPGPAEPSRTVSRLAPPAAASIQPTAAIIAAKPGIEDMPCWFSAPAGRSARCGSFAVPEQRRGSPQHLIHLRFVVFRGDAGGADDPVLYLAGGPGEPAQIDADSIGHWWDWVARAPWLRKRDLVVFDFRGVGLSEPKMNCPELSDAAYRAFVAPLSSEQGSALWSAAAKRCHDRLAASGIDLASYNTDAIIEDAHALVTELGYRRWNLLATSYGTRAALRFIDRWRDGTRAVVLDSVYPPNIAAYVDGGAAAAGVFAALFRDCESDKSCHAAFPTLRKSFEQIVRRAAVAPYIVAVPDPRGGPPLEARLDDGKLIEVLFYAFYDWRRIGDIPAIITALAAADTRPLVPLARVALDNYVSAAVSLGLYLSVECHDEYPFNAPAAIEHATAELPLYRNFAMTTLPLAACPAWPVGEAPAEERRAVASDVPVLLLSGELDPVTPPRWARVASEHLAHAVGFDFRDVGHGVLAAHACAGLIVGRFLADPERSPFDDCLLAVGPPNFQSVASGG